MTLENKTAIVTGGSRGIGRAICVALAEAGANVVTCYAHGAAGAEETVKLCEAYGVKASAIRADVAKNEDINISDDIVTDIIELAYDLYLDDDYMNLSAPQFAFFLTECYAKDNSFMDKVADMDYSDILQAVDNDNYDFYQDEMER